MTDTFTASGSLEAESRVRNDLDRILSVISALLPADSVQLVALAGGFGRGQGGVLRDSTGSVRAFNDYDIVIFTAGSPDVTALLNAAPDLASELGVDFVDFGVLDEGALDRVAPTVFWYEFLEGHRILRGPADFLRHVPRIDAAALPVVEATRLLINRGMGLLWAWLHLEDAEAAPATFDATRRRFTINAIHKAVLGMGESLLIRAGSYHVSYVERARRIAGVPFPIRAVPADDFRQSHSESTHFKLYPEIPDSSVPDLRARWQKVRDWHELFFRCIEETRLGRTIGPWKNYPRRAGEEALARGVRHPRRFVNDLRLKSPLRDPARFILDAELSYRAQLPFLLYGAGPAGPDSGLLASGLRGFAGEKSRDQLHWRNLAANLIEQWHP